MKARDSAPFTTQGPARIADQVARRFRELSPAEKQELFTFLNSPQVRRLGGRGMFSAVPRRSQRFTVRI
jgi:hypothetical protein